MYLLFCKHTAATLSVISLFTYFSILSFCTTSNTLQQHAGNLLLDFPNRPRANYPQWRSGLPGHPALLPTRNSTGSKKQAGKSFALFNENLLSFGSN